MVLGATASFATSAADAAVLARVTLRGGTLTDTTVGGSGQVRAEYADEQSITVSNYTRTSGGSLTSYADAGLLTGSILGEVDIFDSSSRLSPFAEMYIDQTDTYTVGAGTSGLPNGHPVQVRIEADLTGHFVQHGRPSGLGELLFRIQGVPGVTGAWVNWGTGGLNPPQDIEVDEYWAIVVDTTIGASFTLSSVLEATLNGTAFDGPVADGNSADALALIRVSLAPGSANSGIDLTSEAGAPTTPIRVVPLSSDFTIGLLVLALTAAGVVALSLRQRKPSIGGNASAA